jgi:hypothetical protein
LSVAVQRDLKNPVDQDKTAKTPTLAAAAHRPACHDWTIATANTNHRTLHASGRSGITVTIAITFRPTASTISHGTWYSSTQATNLDEVTSRSASARRAA